MSSFYQRRGKNQSRLLISSHLPLKALLPYIYCLQYSKYWHTFPSIYDHHLNPSPCPCVVHMLRDMDIMEDLTDIRRVRACWETMR